MMEKVLMDLRPELGVLGRACAPPVDGRSFGIRFQQQSCCHGGRKGILVKNSNSITMTSSEGIDSVAPRMLLESASSSTNGLNSTSCFWICSQEECILDACEDDYGGIVVNPEKLPWNTNTFAYALQVSISSWKLKGKKGIWLKLPLGRSELVPIAVKAGFKYHHAEQSYVMLTYWLPEGPCLLPANASHQVGVGGFVINEKNEVLVVQEKHCSSTSMGAWKLPTGFILESEEIYSGVVREVKEETGIATEFVEVIAFRHAHLLAFGKSDLFFICMLKPLSTEIKIDEHEIEAAKVRYNYSSDCGIITTDNYFKVASLLAPAKVKLQLDLQLASHYNQPNLDFILWMPLTEFLEQPVIQDDSMFKKILDICIARLRKRYCGLAAHTVISKFDGRSSSLYYNVPEPEDIYCQGV